MENGKGVSTIHVDLDGARHIFRVHGLNIENTHDTKDHLFETGLKNALTIFSEMKIKATLFVIGEDLDDRRKCELLQEAISNGHEIGSHSLTHRKLTQLSREEKRREIFNSREKIEKTLGVKVCGFRAPAFDIDHESLELIAEAGYTYDSSVFPNMKFAEKLKVNHISQTPYPPLESSAFVELPLPDYSPLPFPFHPCYSLVLGVWYFRLGLQGYRKKGGPLVLLFHLTDFSEPLPRHHVPGTKSRFYTLSFLSSKFKKRRCEEMLNIVKEVYHQVDTPTLLEVFRNPKVG